MLPVSVCEDCWLDKIIGLLCDACCFLGELGDERMRNRSENRTEYSKMLGTVNAPRLLL